MKNFPIDFSKIVLGEYISPTRLLGVFEEPFDARKTAEAVTTYERSEYFKIPVDTILDYWKLTAPYGNIIHSEIQDYLTDEKECRFKEELEKYGINYNNSYSEIEIKSLHKKMKGFVDIITIQEENDKKKYIVHDIKTYKKIDGEKIIGASMQILLYCLILNDSLGPNEYAVPGKIIHISNNSKPDNLDYEKWDNKNPVFYDFDKRAIAKLKDLLDRFDKIEDKTMHYKKEKI